MYDRLSDFIHARGISRERLAADARVCISTLDRLFAGHGQAQRKTVSKLAKFLNLPEEQILKMLRRERVMQEKPESLGHICRATAICRAAAKGSTPIDWTKATPYLESLQRAVTRALARLI